MFRAEYRLTKLEINQCRLSEREMLDHHLRQLEANHGIFAGLYCFHREEGENTVLFHIADNKSDPNMILAVKRAYEQYPTQYL